MAGLTLGKATTSANRYIAQEAKANPGAPRLTAKIDWDSDTSDDFSFISEYFRMDDIGGPGDPNNYNKIYSPGRSLLERMFPGCGW